MDLKLNSRHDIDLDNGDFSLTQDESESLSQRLKIKLLTFKGEWFLNEDAGIPYYQRILQKGTPKETIDIIFKRAIAEEPDVISIVAFSSTFDKINRVYSLNFKVQSVNAKEPIPVEIEI